MIGHKVVPSARGGIERVLTTLTPLLAERGAKVVCYNRMGDPVDEQYRDLVKNRSFRNVKLKTAPTLNLRGISAVIASFTAAIAATFGDYDVIHFHAEGPCAAMWIPKLFGKTCVATVHGLDWQRDKWGRGFISRYIHFGEKTLAKCADAIIVLSKPAYDYFRETYGRESVQIPNGTERPRLVPEDAIFRKWGLRKDSYICSVSRLTQEKGIHLLIEAYNSLETDKKLVIAGDTGDSTKTDSYISLLRQMAADNPNILFTGFISGEELESLYSNAYVVCAPSNLEGMSLSLLEALSYSNAVLCSDIPENVCVAEDHAAYFRSSDSRDLARRLGELLEDPQRVSRLKATAADYICSKFSWEEVADRTLSLYQTVATTKRKE